MLPWEELTCWMHILQAVSFPSGPVAGIWYFSGIFCLLQWSTHGFFTSVTVRPRESQHRKYSNFANFRVWLLKACFKLEQQEVGVGQQLLASPPRHHKNLFEFTRVQMFVSTKSPLGLSRRKIAVDVLCARTSKLKCTVKNVLFHSASTKKEIASKTTTMSSVNSWIRKCPWFGFFFSPPKLVWVYKSADVRFNQIAHWPVKKEHCHHWTVCKDLKTDMQWLWKLCLVFFCFKLNPVLT